MPAVLPGNPGVSELFKGNVSTVLHSIISLPVRPTLTDELECGPDDAALVLAAGKLVSRLSSRIYANFFLSKNHSKGRFMN